jgi:hypothetical protein
MKKVILRTPMRTRSNSFSDAFFKVSTLTMKPTKPALTVAPSVGPFSKLTTKPTKSSRRTLQTKQALQNKTCFRKNLETCLTLKMSTKIYISAIFMKRRQVRHFHCI